MSNAERAEFRSCAVTDGRNGQFSQSESLPLPAPAAAARTCNGGKGESSLISVTGSR